MIDSSSALIFCISARKSSSRSSWLALPSCDTSLMSESFEAIKFENATSGLSENNLSMWLLNSHSRLCSLSFTYRSNACHVLNLDINFSIRTWGV
ncbi:hypothetical protein AX774_g8005 [Zancudomyces culisetae]|uniref:Uncharacterized protein n=1 Tax=Zancudomyces culisetae TaxID=1213189 RepID=A0A1R1PCB3_ZANCU|nr:hypothetical protein AX774_g8005 [Zancudomyces culisetae]|eukprot:OMH78600.1 hypothetical protein AX774_g8005 [Zancudomyces culisetae]